MRHEMLIEGATPEEDEIIGEHVPYLQRLTHEPCTLSCRAGHQAETPVYKDEREVASSYHHPSSWPPGHARSTVIALLQGKGILTFSFSSPGGYNALQA